MNRSFSLVLPLLFAICPLPAASEPVVLSAEGAGGPVTTGFVRSASGAFLSVEARFTVQFGGKAEGLGFVLVNTSTHAHGATAPAIPRWEEPNIAGAFGVGFDTSNPPTRDRFNADGNIYGRPEHEVSLHWNGREMANALSPVAYEDGDRHDVMVRVGYVTAGANVTVTIDGQSVYAELFVPDMHPYECRAAFGFSPGDEPSSCAIDFDGLVLSEPAGAMPSSERFSVFEGAVLNAGQQTRETTVDLPDATRQAERVMLTLTLGAPQGGIDPWDRAGHVYVFGDDGQRYEILRFVTPFGRGCQWKADVTDFQSLLRGKRRMAVSISTWVKGWSVDVALEYYWGKPDREAFRVTNLWQGDFEYGNPQDPMDAEFPTCTLTLDPRATSAKLRLVVTGHGMHPNTDNAAEFMPARRKVTVNGKAFSNLLWRTDNYLNPCRPQGGTWKYDRAGWGPGALVIPWEIDVSDLVKPGEPVTIDYAPQPYVNENAGKSRANHIVEAVLIEYR